MLTTGSSRLLTSMTHGQPKRILPYIVYGMFFKESADYDSFWLTYCCRLYTYNSQTKCRFFNRDRMNWYIRYKKLVAARRKLPPNKKKSYPLDKILYFCGHDQIWKCESKSPYRAKWLTACFEITRNLWRNLGQCELLQSTRLKRSIGICSNIVTSSRWGTEWYERLRFFHVLA